MKSLDGSIAAVIVTHNRLQCLKKCINGVRTQSLQPDETIVVDNASTDGTARWLSQQADLVHIRQGNLGSAGGQKTGMITAKKRGHSWIWTMDDDGYPEENALRALVDAVIDYKMTGYVLLNSCVLRPNSCRLTWELRGDDGTLYGNYRKLIQGINETLFRSTFITPFNGTFLDVKTLRKVGPPRPAYFIRGEESDFLHRAERCDKHITIGTVSTSIHRHPPTGKPKGWKKYYETRNTIWNMYQYMPKKSDKPLVAIRQLKHLLLLMKSILTSPTANQSPFKFMGVLDGLSGYRSRRVLPGAESLPTKLFLGFCEFMGWINDLRRRGL